MTSLEELAAAAQGGAAGPQPPAGLPDPALLTRLANELFAAVPGQNTTIPESPSLGGAGVSPGAVTTAGAAVDKPSAATVESIVASPYLPRSPDSLDVGVVDLSRIGGFAPLAQDHVRSLAGASLPGFGASPVAVPNGIVADDVPTSAPASGFPSPGALDAKGIDTLLGPSIPAIGQPLHSTSSLGGRGFSASDQETSVPQSPPPTPPPQVLAVDEGIRAPHSAGQTFDFAHIPLPFESELKSLLAPLAGEGLTAAPHGTDGSTFYFLRDFSSTSSKGSADKPLAGGPGLSSPFASAHPAFDVNAIRRDFPILNEKVNGHPLIWFDNAATTQKPQSVIDRIGYFYQHENSNIHRAAHELAARATDAYEGARNKVARFLGDASSEEIIFTRGTTEAVNLVAATFGHQHVGRGDEIVITNLEHHANIVPWQMLCLAKGAKLRVAPVDDNGALLLEEFGKLLNSRTKLVAFTHVSNALGTITPAKAIIDMARRVGARVLLDGAQSVSHMKVDVQDLNPDFFVFSGHKLFGPTGIGALYAKKELMDRLAPYQTGGNMIRDVTFERTEFHGSPMRFEAGTGNIADAVGLGAAIDYVERIGLENIGRYEHGLLEYATHRLGEIPNLRIIGTAPEKASVISFVIKGLPSEQIGQKLNAYGVAVRSGHHCAQPILRRFGHETTVRPSFAFYNTCAEIDVMIAALKDIQAETGLSRP